jgi:hypothetical protein
MSAILTVVNGIFSSQPLEATPYAVVLKALALAYIQLAERDNISIIRSMDFQSPVHNISADFVRESLRIQTYDSPV